MKYFGLLSHINFEELMNTKLPSPALTDSINSIENLLPNYEKVETLFNYRFRDKAYILQAFTHPSCMTNAITDCYQKLEFIGDAVLGAYM